MTRSEMRQSEHFRFARLKRACPGPRLTRSVLVLYAGLPGAYADDRFPCASVTLAAGCVAIGCLAGDVISDVGHCR